MFCRHLVPALLGAALLTSVAASHVEAAHTHAAFRTQSAHGRTHVDRWQGAFLLSPWVRHARIPGLPQHPVPMPVQPVTAAH